MTIDTSRQSWRFQFDVPPEYTDGLKSIFKGLIEEKDYLPKLVSIGDYDSVEAWNKTRTVYARATGNSEVDGIVHLLYTVLQLFPVQWMKVDGFKEFRVGVDTNSPESVVSVHTDEIRFKSSSKYMTVNSLPGYVFDSLKAGIADADTGRRVSQAVTEAIWHESADRNGQIDYRVFIPDIWHRFEDGDGDMSTDDSHWDNKVDEMEISIALNPEMESSFLEFLAFPPCGVRVRDTETVTKGDNETVLSFIAQPGSGVCDRYLFLESMMNWLPLGDIHWVRGYGYRTVADHDHGRELMRYFDVEKYDYVFSEHSPISSVLVVDRLPRGIYNAVEDLDIQEPHCQLEADVLGDIMHHSNWSNDIHVVVTGKEQLDKTSKED